MTKIMVVDDQEDWTFLVRKILEKSGYEVVEAHSGPECLRLTNDEKPDLVFLDIEMNGTNGWEICKGLKENPSTSSIPVCMLSSYYSDEDVQTSLEYAHADKHLSKTISLDELIETVSFLLNTRRQPEIRFLRINS
ncbi:MAG: PleD family two-component system response regulator [Candidatus Hydrothermarchaeaceae archaeon]